VSRLLRLAGTVYGYGLRPRVSHWELADAIHKGGVVRCTRSMRDDPPCFCINTTTHRSSVRRRVTRQYPADYRRRLAVTRNGIASDIAIYRPPTQQQRGTIVLLHGFPGGRVGEGFSPRTQSLASSLARAGHSVVRFNYIGSWTNGSMDCFGPARRPSEQRLSKAPITTSVSTDRRSTA
jgi:dipeptidyl aminopeptidase/acylaminoacyl peptidase